MNKELGPIAGSLLTVCLSLCACHAPTSTSPVPTPAPATATPIPATATPAPTATTDAATGMRVLWDVATGRAVWESPTIVDGTVYFGSDDGHLYAVDAQDGGARWKFATEGIVRSRPALADGRVYVASDDGFLYAVDAQQGKQIWRTDIGNALARDVREKLGLSPAATGYDYRQSSPVAAEGRVYVGSHDGNVYALAADTGQIAWTYQTGDKVRATPTVDHGVVYIGSWDQSMYALSAADGEVLWRTPLGGQVQTTALVAGDRVYTASRKASVVALDVQTGAIVWEHSYGSNMWVESSPELVNDVIYIASSGSKMVLGLDSATGELVTAFCSLAFHWSTPVVVDRTLYIGGAAVSSAPEDGGLYALKLVGPEFEDARTEHQLLTVQDTLEAEGNWCGVASSPIVADGVIYFGGLDGRLYAVSDTDQAS